MRQHSRRFRRRVRPRSELGRTMQRRIILVRHGPSALRVPKRIPSDRLRSTARRYNEAGVRSTPGPSAPLRREAGSTDLIVCSDARRAVESARVLDRTREPLIDPLFREAGLPLGTWLPLHLSFDTWVLIAGIAWFWGWSAGTESLAEARRRARTAARRLIHLSTVHRSVMLVGHGVFNALIAAELQRRGWQGPLWRPTASPWERATYAKSVRKRPAPPDD
jgi:broad specificity phosphatase PhoE